MTRRVLLSLSLSDKKNKRYTLNKGGVLSAVFLIGEK